MSGYLSNLLTNTTSRYNSLRRTLLSDEADGDTEDDSHICRVLRAYYTEKGSQLPQWLPPDPKRAASLSNTSSFTSGLLSSSQAQPNPVASASKGTLSDLWDSPSRQQAPQQPTSLRRQAPRNMQSRAQEPLAPPQARPLPSQRASSYQSQLAAQARPPSEPSPPQSSGGGGTAQDRLKAKLWGAGRAGSPTPGTNNSNLSVGGRGPMPRQLSDNARDYEAGGGGYGRDSGRDRYGGPGGPRPM